MVIFIDALDKCDDKDLIAEFFEIVADAYRSNQRLPCRDLLTSRVEEHLRKKLEASVTCSVIYHLSLQDFGATDDISKFIQHRFATIYKENCRLAKCTIAVAFTLRSPSPR